MATCLVTGAAGFIGSHLSRALSLRGHRVIGVDRRGGAGIRRIDLADPTDFEALRAAARAADVVFHLAGRAGVRDARPGIDRLRHRDNVEATAAVLAATPLATPVVTTSSSSVYGGARSVGGRLRPCSEDDALRPRGGYARSKLEAERLLERRRDAGGPVTVVRPFTVAGEWQRSDMALARWIEAAAGGLPLVVLGSPHRVRDVTDVRDVVEGLIRAAESGYVGTINLGTGTGRRLEEMVEAVVEAMGRPVRIVVEPAGGEEVEATLADTTRCARVLGFVPHDDLAGLVRRQVAAALGEPETARAL